MRFLLDDSSTGTQRCFVKSEEWPWPWPPQAGIAVQPRGFRSIALEVSLVIYDMNSGEIVVDFVGDRLGDVQGAARELASIGYREIPAS